MTEFENIVIGPAAVPSLAVTVILMIAIPVLFFLFWRGKHKPQRLRQRAVCLPGYLPRQVHQRRNNGGIVLQGRLNGPDPGRIDVRFPADRWFCHRAGR